jgi:hypothetical protein
MARHFGQTASFEQTKSMTYLTRVRSNCRRWVKKLRSALEAAGVVFIAENGGGAGVRFHETKTRKQIEA